MNTTNLHLIDDDGATLSQPTTTTNPHTRRIVGACIALVLVVLTALFIVANAQDAHAVAMNAFPKGYRRCRMTEIQADPAHKVCKWMTWTEPRNGGGSVRFSAYLRRMK